MIKKKMLEKFGFFRKLRLVKSNKENIYPTFNGCIIAHLISIIT